MRPPLIIIADFYRHPFVCGHLKHTAGVGSAAALVEDFISVDPDPHGVVVHDLEFVGPRSIRFKKACPPRRKSDIR